MCGIFGIISDSLKIKADTECLAKHAMQRGRDASGFLYYNSDYKIIKSNEQITSLLPQVEYLETEFIMGHSRLITNGNGDNQPIDHDDVVVIHNGIITNYKDIAKKYNFSLNRKIDTEIISLLFKFFLQHKYMLEDIPGLILKECEGVVAAAVAITSLGKLVLFSNNGSLYCSDGSSKCLFSSEKYPLIKLGCDSIVQIKNDAIMVLDIPISKKNATINEYNNNNQMHYVVDFSFDVIEKKMLSYAVPELKRCTKCLLPHTMPFIEFDTKGVCNYCNNWKQRNQPKPKELLLDLVEPYRSKDNSADCIVPFSGGRDSCYGLHLVVNELGLRPITYTYDWGMITDLGRRNISKISAQLGVENIIVAADIRKKRNNIAKNLRAWLRSPDLGMVNILTAGDKHFFQHIDTVRNQVDVSLNLWGFNPLETTHFKTGFLGMPPDFIERKVYSSGLNKQIKYQSLRFMAMLRNTGYLNSSILDTLSGEYYRSIHKKKDYFQIFDYWKWDEGEINDLLINEYHWELAQDTSTTWRIGDGTAAFYNYIFYTVAGFSEHDTFRSNQIREGDITREQGLSLIEEENRPRYENIRWYLDLLGFDYKSVISIINSIPKLWH